jgi:hypothetical protein
MKNSDMPASPLPEQFGKLWVDSKDTGITLEAIDALGLTKREHFAGLAMQAIISTIPEWEKLGYPVPEYKENVAEAYKYADLMCEAGE